MKPPLTYNMLPYVFAVDSPMVTVYAERYVVAVVQIGPALCILVVCHPRHCGTLLLTLLLTLCSSYDTTTSHILSIVNIIQGAGPQENRVFKETLDLR